MQYFIFQKKPNGKENKSEEEVGRDPIHPDTIIK